MRCLRKFLFIVFVIIVQVGNVSGQLATYVGTGGSSITVTGYPNETVTNLLYTGFGTNTACGSGGRSGLTVNTSWSAYSSVPTSPRVYIQILPNTGYQLNMTGFTANLRSSGTGPTCARFAYSLDNGATWIDDGACHAPNITTTCGSGIVSSWSGGALPAGVTSTTNGIIVAVFPYLPGGSTGTFQVNRIDIAGSVTIACNAPAAITGSASVCSGQVISLSNTATGGTWSTNNTSVATITPTGVVTGGTAGTAVITYSTGCGTDATTTITTNPLPAAGSIAGVPVVCVAATTALSNTASGGAWSSTMASVATVDNAGVVYGISAGSTVVSYTVSNSCGTVAATATVTINPLPIAGTITGTSSVCAGSIIPLSNATGGGIWSSSNTAFATVNSIGEVSGVSGGSSDISYSVTNSCGTAHDIIPVTVYGLPVTYNVTGSGSYCSGSGGLHIGLDGSQSGISYQLYNGPAIGTPMPGTGLSLDFGSQTASGTYIITATDGLTGCVSNMAGSGIITVDPLPNIYSVTGGGPICSGIGGVHVGLSWSDAGINYQLYAGSTVSGGTAPGIDNVLDFGSKTVADTYTVVATNPVTSCSASMQGSVVIIVTPSVTPSVSIFPGTGTICSGRSRTFTATSVNGGPAPFYQWYVNGLPTGTGNVYSYIPANGNVVKVKLTSNTVCPLPDTATAAITLNVQTTETPYVNIGVNPGNMVCEGAHVTYTAMPAFSGSAPIYTWIKNGSAVGSGPSYYLHAPANGDDIYCTMKSNYVCSSVDSVTSGLVHMTLLPFTQPVVTVTAIPGLPGVIGEPVTLKATVSNTGLYSALAYQWLVNGIPVPGANTNQFISTFSYTVADSVTCMVTCTGGPCDPIGVFGWIYVVVYPVGIAQESFTFNNISVTPNPGKGDFKIRGSFNGSVNNNGEMQIELLNMIGQVVYRNKAEINNGKIDAGIFLDNSLANGMYILNLYSNTAKSIHKIMLER